MLPTSLYIADLTTARRILRAYVVTTLYRPSLPGTESSALVLPRRPGYMSVNPERSFSQGLVRSLANRLPEEQRYIIEDLAGRQCDSGRRRRSGGCWKCSISSATRTSDSAPYHAPTTWQLHGDYIAAAERATHVHRVGLRVAGMPMLAALGG